MTGIKFPLKNFYDPIQNKTDVKWKKKNMSRIQLKKFQ